MRRQKEIVLRPRERGVHLVTNEILHELPPLPEVGVLNLFIKHTSAALSVNENADPDVRKDMEYILDKLVPDVDPNYTHTAEGLNDASSHYCKVMKSLSIVLVFYVTFSKGIPGSCCQ